MNKKTVVLAYSGGLDTSCCIGWLKDRGFKVICFSANLGSEFSPDDLRKRAHASGAAKIYIRDLRNEFVRDYIRKALWANALYEGKYVLSTSLGRPLIARHLVDIAHKEKAGFVAHGCTGKGNDQVRIEATVKMLDGKLGIIAPLRQWELTSRESEIDYAKKKKIPIRSSKKSIYSIDKNIWGVSIEAGILEDLVHEPKPGAYLLTVEPQRAPAKPAYVSIEFKKGVPVAVNGRKKSFLAIIEQLNRLGAKHGVGRSDVVENRMVGIKSREIYEAPAAWILITAHKELEALVLDRETLRFKELVSLAYANIAYQGLWFSSLKDSLDAFIEKTQKAVSGTVTLKLYKGSITVAKRKSTQSLYRKELATYGKGDVFDRTHAAGFIEIFSLPYRK